VNFSWFFTGQ